LCQTLELYQMNIKIEDSWKLKLFEEFKKKYFEELIAFVKKEYQNHKCYPPGNKIFNAFEKCDFSKTKVVILGQDPYHGQGQANGLCFSVNEGMDFPPSLRNIFKELNNDLNIEIPKSGNLEKWASQGVLLLNSTLTVRENQAGSHQNKGWEIFTDKIIEILNSKKENLVFLLWGNYAHKKGNLIDQQKHYVLKSKHPSPLSANQGGWFHQNHFSKTNIFLESKNIEPIEW
jgi:uracil-DNA glycosylase